MATAKKNHPTPSAKHELYPLFEKDNLLWMLIGAIVLFIGMMLLSGGKNTNPAVFDAKEIYSFRRITLAPIVIVIGLVIEIYAILKKPKAQQ